MTFLDAVEHLKEKNRVKRAHWTEDYLELLAGSFLHYSKKDAAVWETMLEDVRADDWEVIPWM
jgi:hypothetical protein